jgi:hypothetical protein
MWGELIYRWSDCVVAAGGRPTNAYGVRVDLVDDPRSVAEYVTDSGGWPIGAEIASGPVKMGRSNGRWAPFALLAAACMWGDKDAGDLWTEYETATLGKNAIVASRGLLEMYGITQAADEEAAVEEVTEPLAVVEVDPLAWLALGAVDRQRDFVRAVEEWAAAGCPGAPPDPRDIIQGRGGGVSPPIGIGAGMRDVHRPSSAIAADVGPSPATRSL